MKKLIALAVIGSGLTGCAYLESPEAAVQSYFKYIGKLDAQALKERSASGLSGIDVLERFAKCGAIESVSVKPVQAGDETATFEVTLTGAKGSRYLVPEVTLQKHNLRWYVRDIEAKNTYPEVVAGSAYAKPGSNVVEKGPEIKEQFSPAYPVYYVVKRTVGTCDADMAELEKRTKKVDEDKAPHLSKYQEWEAQEAKKQQEKEAKEKAEADARSALEAVNKLLADSGEKMANELFARYFKLLSAGQAQQAANLVGDIRGNVTEQVAMLGGSDRRFFQVADFYIDSAIVRQAQYGNGWGKKYPVIDVVVVTRFYQLSAKPGDKPMSRQTRMSLRLNEAQTGLVLDVPN